MEIYDYWSDVLLLLLSVETTLEFYFSLVFHNDVHSFVLSAVECEVWRSEVCSIVLLSRRPYDRLAHLGVVFVEKFHQLTYILLLLSKSEGVCRNILFEPVDDHSRIIVGNVFDLLVAYNCQPEVVLVEVCIENWDGFVRSAELWGNGTKCSVSNIDCSIFSW